MTEPTCEHGHKVGFCPWPVGECGHAAPEDYVYFEYEKAGLQEVSPTHFSDLFGMFPKVKMKRTNSPTYQDGRFVGYDTWEWRVYCLAWPKEDLITGEITWEDDPSTMATWGAEEEK